MALVPKQGTSPGTNDLNERALKEADSPTVRLSTTTYSGATSPDQFARAFHPTVRLAHVPGAQGDNNLLGRNGVAPLPDSSLPALLVSFVYLPQFLANRHKYRYRDWVLDSGAFSAHNSGTDVNLDEYITTCRELLASDPTLTEVFALDDIGDWHVSLRNCEKMWAAGVPAVPTFHYGEPWDVLLGIARDYPKIALGGMVGQAVKPRDAWVAQCFSRVWPKRIHGFGLAGEATVLGFPFSSTDATNWEIGPCKYASWQSFRGAKRRDDGRVVGAKKFSVRGSKQNLRVEVEWYLDLERRARARWKKEMAKLDELFGPDGRLALSGESTCKGNYVHPQALGGPAERLGMGPLGGGGGKHSVDSVLIPRDYPTVRHEANGHGCQGRSAGEALAGPPAAPTIRLVPSRGGGGLDRLDQGLSGGSEGEAGEELAPSSPRRSTPEAAT